MKDDREREMRVREQDGNEALPWWETKTVEVTMEGLRFGRRIVLWGGMIVAFGAIVLLLGALTLFHLGYRPEASESIKVEPREWASPQSMEMTTESVRILSLNFNHGAGPEHRAVEQGDTAPVAAGAVKERVDRLAQLVLDERVDVVVLQGVDFESEYSGSLDQVEYLASKLKWGYVIKARSWRHPYLPFPEPLDGKIIGKVDMGLAIVSRFALFNTERFSLPRETLDDWWKTTFAPNYCLLKTELTLGGKKLFVYNTELTAGAQSDRERQAREVAAIISQTSNGRGLLAGTFWAEPKVKGMKPKEGHADCTLDLIRHRMNFNSLYKDWEVGKDRQAFVTFTDRSGAARVVDYVVPERKLEVHRWQRLEVDPPISAHTPILVEVLP